MTTAALCPNCESDRHARCCSWCGQIHKPKRLEHEHCSAKCERAAAEADRRSDEMQADADAQREVGCTCGRSWDTAAWPPTYQPCPVHPQNVPPFPKAVVTNTKFRRVKVSFYTYGGKGARSWRQPHERYAWVPVADATNERVTIVFPDLGEQECTIIGRDTLVIPGELRAQCEDLECPGG